MNSTYHLVYRLPPEPHHNHRQVREICLSTDNGLRPLVNYTKQQIMQIQRQIKFTQIKWSNLI